MPTILSGHNSPETAYLVADYPYGFKLRCQIRYWMEFDPKKGARLCSQTSNPKRPGLVWNAPKKSTYCRFGGVMILNDEGHVTWTGLNEYTDHAEAQAWYDAYHTGLTEEGEKLARLWCDAKRAYEKARDAGEIRIEIHSEA